VLKLALHYYLNLNQIKPQTEQPANTARQ
jgi:hypothetical protein